MEPSLGKEVKRRSWRRTLAHACRKRTRHIRSKTQQALSCLLMYSPQYTDRRPRQNQDPRRENSCSTSDNGVQLECVRGRLGCPPTMLESSSSYGHAPRTIPRQPRMTLIHQRQVRLRLGRRHRMQCQTCNLSHQFGLESADKSLRRSEHNRRDTGKILKKSSLSLPAASFSSSR